MPPKRRLMRALLFERGKRSPAGFGYRLLWTGATWHEPGTDAEPPRKGPFRRQKSAVFAVRLVGHGKLVAISGGKPSSGNDAKRRNAVCL